MLDSFLTLGDMLTFVGLILAVFQLMKPRHTIIWKLSSKLLKLLAIALLAIGYLSPLAAILIPDTEVIWNGLTLDRLLQVVGFVLITIGLLIVAFIYSRFNYRHLITNVTKYRFHSNRYPKKKWRSLHFQIERNKTITTRSAKKFYEITSMFLVRGHIEEVVEITRLNLKPLVHSALQYTPKRFRLPEEENKEPAKPNGSNFAYETLYQLLTDQSVMKHICTNNRFFLHAIVECEIDDNSGYMHNEFAGALYNNLVEHLVLNANSFLYTQKDANSGSARFANVYDLLTDEKIIRRQRIIPSMLTWNVGKTDVPPDEYTDVLLKLLERMIDSYKKQPDSTELLANIRQAFNQLVGDDGITRRLAYDKKARQQFEDDHIGSMAYKVFSKIHLAVSTGLLYRDDDPDSFKTNEAEQKSENKQGAYDQTTLTGLFAYKIYELIEDLTVFFQDTDDPDDGVRREMFNYLTIHVNTAVATRYKDLVYERLFDKAIYGKLEIASNIDGYYPNVLRPLISFLAPFKHHFDDAEARAQVKLMSIMDNQLKEALLADKMMANDEPMKDVLLPSNIKVTINKTKKTVKYHYINSKGKKTTIILNKPIGEVKASTPKSKKASKSK